MQAFSPLMSIFSATSLMLSTNVDFQVTIWETSACEPSSCERVKMPESHFFLQFQSSLQSWKSNHYEKECWKHLHDFGFWVVLLSS
jgi:hypothetical protein